MKAELIPFVPPNYDPYDECVCGTHQGETMMVGCDRDVTIQIDETRSGIGNFYKIIAVFKNGARYKLAEVYVDDDGENVVVRERGD